MTDDEINRFEPIGLSASAAQDLDGLRARLTELEEMIVYYTSPGRERSLALTALEEASHWAARAIALGGRGQR